MKRTFTLTAHVIRIDIELSQSTVYGWFFGIYDLMPPPVLKASETHAAARLPAVGRKHGTDYPFAHSYEEGYPLTSFENPPKFMDLFQEFWRILQDFENISNILKKSSPTTVGCGCEVEA